MAEVYASNQGVKIALNCCLKAPANIELKRHALNWTKEDNPKESDVVFELRGGFTQDVLPPSIHPDTNKPYFWVGDYKNIPELPLELLNIWTQWDIAKDVLKVRVRGTLKKKTTKHNPHLYACLAVIMT